LALTLASLPKNKDYIMGRDSRKPAKWASLVLGLLASASFCGFVSAQSTPTTESGLDLGVKPGDDFYAFANGTDEDLRQQLATGTHAPQNFRADTVRNIDAWDDAFDVTPGQRLYLEPGARVHVW
jgi:predicted metalloendopeptidase